MRKEVKELVQAAYNYLHEQTLENRGTLLSTAGKVEVELRTHNLSFSEALYALREGACVQREGWNGKGMHIFLEEHFTALINMSTGVSARKVQRKYEPVICLWTAQKTTQPGWLPSQQDLLADDWTIL
jgi:hypothetical protein